MFKTLNRLIIKFYPNSKILYFLNINLKSTNKFFNKYFKSQISIFIYLTIPFTARKRTQLLKSSLYSHPFVKGWFLNVCPPLWKSVYITPWMCLRGSANDFPFTIFLNNKKNKLDYFRWLWLHFKKSNDKPLIISWKCRFAFRNP